MSKQSKSTHLKYGQGILIEGFKIQSQDKGFLTAKGFADAKAKYETYDDILYFKNYRNAIFQILPAGNFELNDQLEKALIDNEGNQDTPNIKILKSRAESERKQFQLIISNKDKELVHFGQTVIFKHIDSESYVSGTIKPSNGSNGAFTVQVSNKLSESLLFRLQPYRSFQFMDMPIPFDSPVKLLNMYNNGYLTFQKLGLPDIGRNKGTYIEKKPIESNDSYKIPVKTTSKSSSIYEVVTHFVDLSCEKQAPMPWRFQLHVNEVQNDVLIQHDIVYLEHTQNQGVLTTVQGEIVLKQRKQSNGGQLSFYECLWEIQTYKDIDPEGSYYILRHLMSGWTLGVVDDEHGCKPTLIDISQGKAQSPIGYVKLMLAKKEGQEINSESFVNVVWGNDFKLLQVDQSEVDLQQSMKRSFNKDAMIDLFQMGYLYKKSVNYNIRKLIFKNSVAQEHCFKIMEIEDELKKDLLFALSFHSVIINLKQDLQWGAIQAAKKIDYMRMLLVTAKIKEIKTFVKNCQPEDADLEYILPIQSRQNICLDLGLSQLLFELLYFMKMNLKEDIFSDKHIQREKFTDLYNALYQTILELIRSNLAFKMHVSRWFEFILQDVLSQDEPYQLKVIEQLLKDNEFFVSNFVGTALIKYLTQSLIKKNNKAQFIQIKYLYIFRLFCKTGSTVNTSNQIMILEHFFNHLISVKSPYYIRLLAQEGKVCVQASLDKVNLIVLPFEEFYQKCQQTIPSAWSYFCQFLNLAADMIQGRNKTTESQISEHFSLQILGDLFQSYSLYQAEVPIIRLIHYLYAEGELYYPIQRQRKILNFNKLGQRQEILITTSRVKPWNNEFLRILQCLLSKLEPYGPVSPLEYSKNLTLHTLLCFLWETINLGFWLEKHQTKTILNHVLRILSKSDDIRDYATVMDEKKDNILMKECKLECLKIIQLLCDYDTDIFVNIIASKFKTFEIPQKKFSLKGMFSGASGGLLQIKSDPQMVADFLALIPSQQQIQPILQTNICDLMIEITNYNSPKLTSKAIDIMERALQTRKHVMKQFSELIIISQEERLQLQKFMEQQRNKFFLLADTNTVGVDQQNQSSNYYRVSDKQSMGLIEVMYMLTQLMKNENSILQIGKIKSIHQSGIYEALGTNRLINFTGQRSSTNRMKQQIVYASNLHQKVLAYIFNCTEFPETELATKLLHMSYYFIVSLIENFNQIKNLMQKFIPHVSHHIARNVGCIDFLKEMYDNNKTMLYNESMVFKLIKQIFQGIEAQPEDSYYKSKLLDFFRYLIYCNGRSLRMNQIQILKIMQDDSYHNIVIRPTVQEVAELVAEYERDNADEGPIVKMSPKLTYFSTFFQILGSLIDSQNAVNIGKLIKRFPFDHLVALIYESKSCWPLKRNIRAFINRLYYFRDGVETNLKTILGQSFKNIAQNLNRYIVDKLSPRAKQLQNRQFENPVRFSFIESYHYLSIQECMFTLFQLITRQKVKNQIIDYTKLNCKKTAESEGDLSAAYNLIRITERFGFLQKYFTECHNISSNSIIKFILSKMKIVLAALDEPQIYFQGLPQNVRTLDKDDERYVYARQLLIDKIVQGKIKQFFVQNSPKIRQIVPLSFLTETSQKEIKPQKANDRGKLLDVLRSIFKREKRDFNNEDERILYNLQQLISSLKLCANSQKYMLDEYNEKVLTYSSREDIYEFIQRIIQINSLERQTLSPDLKVFFLQFITGLVEQANKNYQEGEGEPAIEGGQHSKIEQPAQIEGEPAEGSAAELHEPEVKPEPESEANAFPYSADVQPKVDIDEWQAQDWDPNAEKISQVQIKLKRCNLGLFITDLLKEDISNNIELANSILLCATAYLLGGNSATQKSIIDEIQGNDPENKVFENIEILIIKLGKLIRKNIDENSVKQELLSSEFNPTTIDNYDYYDVEQHYTLRKNVFEPASTEQHIYNKLCITTYRRAFKFLQLLCQNNNEKGKHLIREQQGKNKKFNFINITTKQLRNLFQIYCQQIKEVPLFLLDFILEVAQVPIMQNQAALMNSTFFEDVCQMSAFFVDEKHFGQRQLHEQDKATLQQIYFKCIKIVLSCFQGNDESTFELLDVKLDPKFLPNLLSNKLTQMNILNRDDLIAHIRHFSNQVDQNGSKNTGFDDDILNILDGMVIFKKMQDYAFQMKKKSVICTSYEKFKKQIQEKQEQKLLNKILQTGVNEQEAKLKAKQEIKNFKCMYTYLQKCLIKIQITHNAKNQTLYFPNFPVFKSLSGNLRDEIMKQVKREGHRDKIVSLLSFSSAVKEKIEYSYNLQKVHHISQQNMATSYWWASRTSILICLYLIVFYNIAIEYGGAEYYSSWPVGIVRFLLSLVQLTFTVYFVYYWHQLRSWHLPQPVNRTKKTEEGFKTQKEETPEAEQLNDILPEPPAQGWKKYMQDARYYYQQIHQKIQIYFPAQSEEGQEEQKIYKSLQFWRVAIFLLCSIVGTFIYPPLIFLHLIDIFAQIPDLGRILESVLYNFKSLAWVSIMGVVFAFVFCTVTFSNYMKNVYASGQSVDEMCSTMFECVSTLYVAGVIGETMQQFQINRFIYDTIYSIFFSMIFANIVSGIMLDAFGSLRQQADELSQDKQNLCYICNAERDSIEKQGDSFKNHTRNKHFLWNYLFYIYVLERKNQTDYTGMEYFISNKYNVPDQEMEVDWIPDRGASSFELEAEAVALKESAEANLEIIQKKKEQMDEKIGQFKALAIEYL